ncbi:hypothetical protein ACGFNU_03480 [Spirillospora sp. NPDC048911]|uniref:hypothetical protein n=1 Tax=Spirillospora sp. NPDC048911 TaxID=3364527 RepID=UPI003718FE4C
MPTTPPTRIDLREVRHRNRTAREAMARLPHTIPGLLDINASLDDNPLLASAVRHLSAELAQVRRRSADLIAAARATLTAERDAEPDPLYYLRDELRAQGHLPPDIRGDT